MAFEIGVEYASREKPNLNKDNLNEDELIKDDENQMMASLYDSVSLDFNEAIVETNVPQDLLMILKEFFFTEMPIKKIDVYHKISKIFTFNWFCWIHCLKDAFFLFKVPTMNSTLTRFMSKNAFFKTLTYNDQTLIYQENLNLLIHFCLVKYYMASTGFDQMSWLMMNNISVLGTYF